MECVYCGAAADLAVVYPLGAWEAACGGCVHGTDDPLEDEDGNPATVYPLDDWLNG